MENGTERVRYLYDELNQLVREDSAVQNKSIEYVYDGGGNLLARKEYAYTTGELGGVMNTVSYGYSGSWKDLLTSYNGTAISYDTIGNPLTWRGGLSFTWQNGRQLSTAQKSGLSLSYTYNASGIRTEKTVNGVTTEYYLDGSSIVAEKTGTDVIWYLYDGMGLAGFELNGTSYYYVYNGQGDVIGILDSSGNRVVTYTYDAWGSPLSVTGSRASTVGQKNPIRYRGYYYDTETGLYYLQSRYYDPVVGRFLNGDAIMGVNPGMTTYNLFVYCGNNPINRKDSTGYVWEHCGIQYDYDGSIADFRRAEHGQAPLAYDKAVASCSCRKYLPEGGVTGGGATSDTAFGSVIRTDAITYVAPEDVVDLYKRKNSAKDLAISTGVSVLDIVKGTKATGAALLVYTTLANIVDEVNYHNLCDTVDKARAHGNGIVIYKTYCTDPRAGAGNGFGYLTYAEWDNGFGNYPYASNPFH